MQRIAVVVALFVLACPAPARAQDTAALKKEMEAITLLLAQNELILPFRQAPMPCFAPWVADDHNLIRSVSPSVVTAGLQRGDVLRKVGAQALDGSAPYEWQTAMSRMTSGLTSFFVEVSRGGKPVTLSLPCQAQIAQRLFEAERRMLTAITQRNWNACLTSGALVIDAYAMPVSEIYSRMKSCATMADVDEREEAEYIFYHALALTQESRALVPKPQDLVDNVNEALLQLDFLRLKGGEDHASKLRGAMGEAGMAVPEFSADKLIERIAAAVGSVVPTTGTGFVVHPSGAIVTAHHVIDGATSITVQCGTGAPLEAKVQSKSAALDIAVLAVKSSAPMAYLDIARDVADVQLGSAVFTVGFPVTELLGNDAKFTEGTISGLSGLQGDASFFQVSAPIQPGNSGGALVDARGRVVGVMLSTASAPLFLGLTGTLPQNVNWAVKSPALRAMMTPPAPRAAAVSREAAIKLAVAATCFIKGTP